MARFRKKSRKFSSLRIWGFFVLAAIVIPVFIELYKFIIPFNSVNPMWKDVTVGEPVIDNWVYEGYTEEGYLKFYDHGMVHTLPPTSHLLGLDGKFVVIEESSPSSLTFAPKLYEAVPFKWYAGVFVGFVAALGLLYLYLRRWLKHIRFKPARHKRFHSRNR